MLHALMNYWLKHPPQHVATFAIASAFGAKSDSGKTSSQDEIDEAALNDAWIPGKAGAGMDVSALTDKPGGFGSNPPQRENNPFYIKTPRKIFVDNRKKN
jgi:hypothetical protein